MQPKNDRLGKKSWQCQESYLRNDLAEKGRKEKQKLKLDPWKVHWRLSTKTRLPMEYWALQSRILVTIPRPGLSKKSLSLHQQNNSLLKIFLQQLKDKPYQKKDEQQAKETITPQSLKSYKTFILQWPSVISELWGFVCDSLPRRRFWGVGLSVVSWFC